MKNRVSQACAPSVASLLKMRIQGQRAQPFEFMLGKICGDIVLGKRAVLRSTNRWTDGRVGGRGWPSCLVFSRRLAGRLADCVRNFINQHLINRIWPTTSSSHLVVAASYHRTSLGCPSKPRHSAQKKGCPALFGFFLRNTHSAHPITFAFAFFLPSCERPSDKERHTKHTKREKKQQQIEIRVSTASNR